MSELQSKILLLLVKKGALSRSDIMEELSIPWTTAYDNLEALEKEGKVMRYKKKMHRRGRFNVFWEVVNGE